MFRPVIVSLMLLSAPTGAQQSKPDTAPSKSMATHPLIGDTIGLDHVLLWSKDDDKSARFLEEKLGFRLTKKPGSYGAGIANRLIWFDNVSFIEFLWLSDAELTRKEAPNEFAHVTGRGGSNSFGVQVEDVDKTYRVLEAAHLHPEKPGGEEYDFDGPEGPKPPVVNQWRFMFLKPGALPGNPFFVEYNLPEGTANPRSDQPNGAKALSSVWVMVKDLPAAEAAYGDAKFARSRVVTIPGLGSGVALASGEGEIVLITPLPDGPLQRQLDRYGDHVIGMSIKVADLDMVSRTLSRKFSQNLSTYAGIHGRSVLPPAFEALGMHIEFHE
jgi:catechol 2,3-dioxygenase-like lactoylglutathione lyase family enzyme